jgi:hypothetical protein
MRRIATFEEKTLAPASELTMELESGNVLKSFRARAGGYYTNSGTSTSAVGIDGPCSYLGKYEVRCGSRNIVNMPASDLRHLTALLAGGYGPIVPATIANVGVAITGKVLFEAALPFHKIHPRMRIDGRQEKVTFRARTGPITDLGSAAASVTGTLTAFGDADDAFDERLFLEPDIRTVEIPLAAVDRNTLTIKFGDDELVFGVMIKALDESQRLTDPNLCKPDTFVRRFALERQKQGRSRENVVPPIGWSFLRSAQTYDFGIDGSTGQAHAGVGVYWIDDPASDNTEAAFFEAGDQMTIVIDASTAVEGEYSSATAPTLVPGEDKALVTIISGRPRGRAYTPENRARALAALGIVAV